MAGNLFGWSLCYDLPQNRWKHYKWIPEDSTSLPYNKVISIFEDSHKRIWFTTQGAGFCRFCPKLTILFAMI